jgi:prepilin signal peptidase PulO-like enzyme (type II secretory pathway)
VHLTLVLLFLVGAVLGGLVNLGVYRLAWRPRPISPWSEPAPDAPPRRPTDRVPVLGWLGLRREASVHGPGFWVRPMLVELLCGLGVAALYWWEIDRLGLLPAGVPHPAPAPWLAMLHVQLAVHVALIMLMLVGSLIDVDEKTIPDPITVPGTLLALLAAAVYPWSLLPDAAVRIGMPAPANLWNVQPAAWPFMRLTSPNAWPPWLDGFPHVGSLLIGLGCWWLWCVALMPRSWYARHGWRRAAQLLVARLCREPATMRISLLAAVGSLGIAARWAWTGPGWAALLTALIGMAATGGIVWAVRVVGTAALQREAMGFGDVTLMAMIGAFLGWQAGLLTFFIAPFAALVVGVLVLALRRDTEVPYGPFLCLAALIVLVCWAAIWDRTWVYFEGLLVPVVVVFCIALMPILLFFWRLVREGLG